MQWQKNDDTLFYSKRKIHGWEQSKYFSDDHFAFILLKSNSLLLFLTIFSEKRAFEM